VKIKNTLLFHDNTMRRETRITITLCILCVCYLFKHGMCTLPGPVYSFVQCVRDTEIAAAASMINSNKKDAHSLDGADAANKSCPADANAHAKGFGSDANEEKLCGNVTGFLNSKVPVEISTDRYYVSCQ
jgi:hypothetical protein